MNALFAGIYSKFTTNNTHAFYTSIGGRLYHKKAPQSAAFPYCVFSMSAHDHDWDFSNDIELISIQFNIFSQNNSASEAGTILSNLYSLFDNCALTASGYTHVYMQRNFTAENNYLDEVPPVFGYSVEYEVMLRK